MKVRGMLVILAVVVSGSVFASRATVGAASPPSPALDQASERFAFETQAAMRPETELLDDVLAVGPPAVEETSAQTVPSPLPLRAQVAATPPPVIAAPARNPAAPTLAPAPIPAATAAPAPATCPKDWFCYPRLGVAGPIVPYTDCSGSTDVGTAIRSYTCLGSAYLMGHAYTQFGLVTQWRAGDQIFAWGRLFTVYGAVTEQSCASPVFPLAALSLQTSLSSSACGPVLVVQAR